MFFLIFDLFIDDLRNTVDYNFTHFFILSNYLDDLLSLWMLIVVCLFLIHVRAVLMITKKIYFNSKDIFIIHKLFIKQN